MAVERNGMGQVTELLAGKFEEIERRMLAVLEQLDDAQVNWRPNASSNSIASLVVHIDGNIKERIGQGILGRAYIRNREQEFADTPVNRQELVRIVKASFGELIEVSHTIDGTKLMSTQLVRGRERINLDILMQCAAHFSEHLGQILYIGKCLLGDDYVTTSIPRAGR